MNAEQTEHLVCENWGVRGGSNFRTESISCTVRPGEVIALVGGPGAGKSLLLEQMAGVQRPGIQQYGALSVARTGLVPQDARLSALPTDRVWTILGLNSWAQRVKLLTGVRWQRSAREEKTRSLLSRLRLDVDRIAGLPFRELSVTERRATLLGAVLLEKPDILLLDGWDETMDSHGRRATVELLKEFAREGMSLVISSRHHPLHDFGEVRRVDLSGGASRGEIALPLIQKHTTLPKIHRHPVLEVSRVRVERRRLGLSRKTPHAYPVDGATFFVRHNETLVLLGAEGSGKTKLLEAISGLSPPSSGTIRVSGNDVTYARGSRARRVRRDVQLVFQDASAALDGQRSVLANLEEAIKLVGGSDTHPGEWLETLGLSPRLLNAPADQLSSSEGQRINLIRCLILRPALILLDSPEVSGADTDGGLISSVLSAEKTKGRSFLLTTSDPEVADTFADRVAVLHAGRILELGSRDEVLRRPAHPVTKALIEASPLSPANPTMPSIGCPHLEECVRRRLPECQTQEPMLAPLFPQGDLGAEERHGIRRAACFHPYSIGVTNGSN